MVEFQSYVVYRPFVTYTYAVPEPATWGLLLVGFGLAGATLRRRKARIAA